MSRSAQNGSSGQSSQSTFKSDFFKQLEEEDPDDDSDVEQPSV